MTTSASAMTVRPGSAEPPFALYVHWPFCESKCPYCDFNSHVDRGGMDAQAFADAYLREMDHFARRTGARRLVSIFFGGGTPSLMPAPLVGRIIAAARDHWRADAHLEVTLEANPSSVEANRFARYRAAGVNRLSLGVQALNDGDLKTLGRLHDRGQALHALDIARNTFDRVSVDLIYGRPHQSLGAWQAELDEALDLGLTHMALYQLTIEQGTPFFALHAAGKLSMPDENLAADLYGLTQEMCAARGLPAYEISNHAAAAMESRHNLVYWRYGEYAGIGPGAHGRLQAGGHRRTATATERQPQIWMRRVHQYGNGLVIDDPLSAEEQGDEYLLMGLRLREGIDLRRYEAISGRRLDPRRCAALEEHDLVRRMGDNRVAVTAAGFLVLDAVVADLAA